MQLDSKIAVLGAGGMVGSAIVRKLLNEGYTNVKAITRKEVNLVDQRQARGFFDCERPTHVFLAAARVGGIGANQNMPAQFLYDNLMIQSNVIDVAYYTGVNKLLFLGSSCIYPQNPRIPITEDQLLQGAPESTNDSYSIAKIAGIKMCQAYRKQYGFNAIALMPTNIYGPGDNFDSATGHVIPSLMLKFHTASLLNQPSVSCWGDGSPYREFMHVDDLADACLYFMNAYDGDDIINIGTGKDIQIKALAEEIATITNYNGHISWDQSQPNGVMRKLLDISRASSLGWSSSIPLRDGLHSTYEWFIQNRGKPL